jgi:5-methylcytosine-specific restriction endonuclease McrA
MARTGAGKPCPHIDRAGRSCPELAPCPVHGKPKDPGRWGNPRPSWERAQRARLRAAKLQQVGHQCERCAAEDVELQLHHVKPISPTSTLADVRLLCRPCHRAVDPSAR